MLGRRVRGALSLALLIAVVGTAPLLAEREEAERVVRELIRDINDASPMDCPADLRDQYGADLICAHFDATFSSFKFSVRLQLERMAYEQIVPTSSWRLSSGLYVRTVEVDTTPMTVAFDEKNRQVFVRFDPEPEKEDPADMGDPQIADGDGSDSEVETAGPVAPEPPVEGKAVTTHDGPFFSGLGGASRPVLIRHSQVAAEYPDVAENEKIEGSVILEGYVQGNGTVGRIEAVQVTPEDKGLAEAAIEALEQWRFQPGARDGVAVDVFFTIVFEFKFET